MLPFVFFTILSQINIIIYSRDNIKSEKIKGAVSLSESGSIAAS